MTQIIAGTAFGQALRLPLNAPKGKNKMIKYGIMKKQIIRSITGLNQDHDELFYASDKNIYMNSNQNQQSTIYTNKYNKSNIISIYSRSQYIYAALNDGSIIAISKNLDNQNWLDNQILTPKFQPNIKKQYNKMIYDYQYSFCLVGKQVLPFLFDLNKNVVSWNGKNVPNDQLDLKVPINDTHATFFKNNKHIACAHAQNKVRIYDVRTNKQKPSADYHLKLQKVYNKVNLTKIIVNRQNQNTFYISNDIGGIYECDIRKQMQMTGKFKGINSTVTDIIADSQRLYVSSLDSYVRIFNLQSKQLEDKHYMNKPIYSIKLKESQDEENNDFQQQVLSEEQYEENEVESKKMKKLRKRNKVNLKYLKPVNWDQVPIKQELLQQAKEQYEQINSKDADSYLDEEGQYEVKDQHDSNQEKDSDLD